MRKVIFCIGCDRSGTTLLAREVGNIVIGSFVVPECYFFEKVIRISSNVDSEVVKGFLKDCPRYRQWRKKYDFPDFNWNNKLDSLIKIIEHNYPEAAKASYLIDSTPSAGMWKVLSQDFENCTYIAIKRSAKQVVTSLLGVKWGPVHTGEAFNYWLDKTSLALGFSDCIVNYSTLISSDKGKPPVVLSSFLRSKDIEILEETYGKSQLINTLPSFTRSQHALLANDFDKRKLKVPKGVVIDYFYKRNPVVVHLDSEDSMFVPEKKKYNYLIELAEFCRSKSRKFINKLG